MGRVTAIGFVIAVACAAACGRSTPQPPTISPPPSGSETINGTERLGWDQRAADPVELSTIRYAIYVDGARSELSGVSCGTTATSTGFSCTARLPALAAGSHSLELASFVQDGGVLESARSAALRVTVTASTAGTGSTAPESPERPATARWPAAANRIAGALAFPADLALLPDGRLLVAERAGRIRMVRDGALLSEPAVALDGDAGGAAAVLALAVDPQFDRTPFVYAISTARSRSGALTFELSRFRAAGDTLGDRVVLLDSVRASAAAFASLRFGPDGKLYAAFDDGGDPRSVDDPASWNGKILRLNRDGSTPDDQARHSPVVSTDVRGPRSPRGLAWPLGGTTVWSADADRVGATAWTPPPLAIAAFADRVYIASARGLQRARLVDARSRKLTAISSLVSDVAVRAVAAAADGTVYFATDTAVGMLRP